MATTVARDELTRSMSRKASFASPSTKGWASASFREAFGAQGGDVFQKSGRRDDEEELKWAAIERLPTYDQMRKGILKQVLDNGNVIHEEVDFGNLGVHNKKQIMDHMLKALEDDNERFLLRLRERLDRVGINEVRFEHLSVEGDAFAGSRALPTLPSWPKMAAEAEHFFHRQLVDKHFSVKRDLHRQLVVHLLRILGENQCESNTNLPPAWNLTLFSHRYITHVRNERRDSTSSSFPMSSRSEQ